MPLVRGLGLQHRIVLAFAVVVVVATTAAALVASSVTTRAMRQRMENQLAGAADILSRGGLALNAAVLQNARGIVGAEVVTFDDARQVVATTVPPDRAPLIEAAARMVGDVDGATPTSLAADCGEPCIIAYRPIEGRPGFAVVLIAETAELNAATRAVTRAIALGAALSAIVLLVIGQIIVRRVTRPMQDLVQFARDLDPEDVSRRADVGDGEVGALAEAFNGMLDRLQRAQSALVRSEKMALAGMLAARVAHDIRNPLAAIKLQTQVLQARLQDPDDQSTVHAVIHDIRQVESVVSDLIELARPGDLNSRPASVNGVVQDALDQLLPQFTHRKIAVRTRFADGLPDVLLDPARFRQALLNILVNASEALPRGGEILLESRRETAGIVLDLCDDGVGIDPALLPTVFDPFVSTKREGVGLGLVNARSVVEAHGGRIDLIARQPRGTCARITLPIHHG